MVFGVTSANIRTINVRLIGVAKGAGSPSKIIAIEVAMEAARKFTKLLPIKMIPISLSGVSSNLLARLAPGCFFLLRCFSR